MTGVGQPELRTVELRQLPVDVWVQAKQHNDELVREFTLMTTATAHQQPAEPHVPARLITLIDALRQAYGGGADERDARLFAAHEAGVVEVDVVLELPPAAADGVTALGALLDEADEYCRQGQHLLTLATPPEIVRFRRWYLAEVATQLRGAAPTPWPAYAPA